MNSPLPTHPFGPGPTATIREGNPRADAWRLIFGGLTAPIKTALPMSCVLPDGPALVYWLDIGRIDSEMMDRLIAHTQQQFVPGVPMSMVRTGLMSDGMTIKEDDVATVTNEHPETLIVGTRYQRETAESARNR